MTELDRRGFMLAGAIALRADPFARSALLPAPHAALHIYTRPRLLARHAKIVAAAIERRVAAHTSGWRRDGGAPQFMLGPVRDGAGHWKQVTWVKPIDRAWPFAAVLEYDPRGEPEAYVDWFRRADDAQADDGWMLDPGVGYVEHINAELATSRDEHLAYLGLVDTPTGGHVGGSQFVVRARVRWADQRRVQTGWWLRFEVDRGRGEVHWRVLQAPLVDWRVTKTHPKLGIVATAPVADPDRELAVWASERVFRFPAMPVGLTAGR